MKYTIYCVNGALVKTLPWKTHFQIVFCLAKYKVDTLVYDTGAYMQSSYSFYPHIR